MTLLNNDTVFTLVLKVFFFYVEGCRQIICCHCVSCDCHRFTDSIFKTSLGLSIRATGDNADMVRASSINDAVKMVALAISNACIAFCGGLIAQYQSFADINSGVGILVVGLASVIIGEAFWSSQKSDDRVYFSHCGFYCIPLYYCSGNKSDMFPAYMLKLISAIIVTVALAVPAIKAKMANDRLKRNGMRESDGGR